MSFSDLIYADKRKQIRRERFLAEIELFLPWSELVALIEPHYPRGRCAKACELLIRTGMFNLNELHVAEVARVSCLTP